MKIKQINDTLKTETEAANKKYNDALKESKSEHDSVVNAANKKYDDAMRVIKAEKDAVVGTADKKFNDTMRTLITEQKTAINNANKKCNDALQILYKEQKAKMDEEFQRNGEFPHQPTQPFTPPYSTTTWKPRQPKRLFGH